MKPRPLGESGVLAASSGGKGRVAPRTWTCPGFMEGWGLGIKADDWRQAGVDRWLPTLPRAASFCQNFRAMRRDELQVRLVSIPAHLPDRQDPPVRRLRSRRHSTRAIADAEPVGG